MRFNISVMVCLVDPLIRCACWPRLLFKDFGFIALEICSSHTTVMKSFTILVLTVLRPDILS
jgi:hypothetical protein